MAEQQQSTDPLIAQRGNGLAIAALVVGIVGAAFGLIPLTFFIALILGVIAVVLGIPALRSAYKGRGRKVMAWIGTLLGVAAIALGIWGAVIVNDVFEDTEQELEQIERDLEREFQDPQEQTVEWLGIPWWVWVFVIPELTITVIWVVVVLPVMGVAALVERIRSDSSRDA